MRAFLEREGTCLVLGPHHDVGRSPDLEERDMEYHHHGDALVPRQQRFGGYTRSLMNGLGIPVDNRWGLRPAMAAGSNADRSAERREGSRYDRGWLAGVANFNFHMHLPHYAVHGRAARRGPRPGRSSRSISRGRIPSRATAHRVQYLPLDASRR